MIRVTTTGDDPKAFAKELERGMSAAVAAAGLRVAQDAAGELAEQSMALLTKDPTGALARSFEARLVSSSGLVFAAEAGSRLPYARIQDEGGIIRPRRRKYLAIPIPGRVPRGMGPREYPRPLSFVATKRGEGLLIEKQGRGGALLRGLRAIYALKRSVRIPGVRYVEAAYNELEPTIAQTFVEYLGEHFERAAKAARGKGGE